jgi:hypothetical protein
LDKELIEYLLSIGALEFVYVDSDDEDIYRFTKDAKELVPDIYNEHMKEFNNIIFSLWMKNIIDIMFDENGEPLIGVNDNTYSQDAIDELEEDEQNALREIVHAWKEIED